MSTKRTNIEQGVLMNTILCDECNNPATRCIYYYPQHDFNTGDNDIGTFFYFCDTHGVEDELMCDEVIKIEDLSDD